jgi:hypothetical protein
VHNVQNAIHRSIQFCTGGSTGFTLATIFDLVNFQTLGSAVAFLGSATFTMFSWWLSRKAELLRIERETAAAELAFSREQKLADLQAENARQMEAVLHEIRLTKIKHDAGLPDDPGPVS